MFLAVFQKLIQQISYALFLVGLMLNMTKIGILISQEAAPLTKLAGVTAFVIPLTFTNDPPPLLR